jgi:hypothetical protein
MHIPRLGVKADLFVLFPGKGNTKERTEERFSRLHAWAYPLALELALIRKARGSTLRKISKLSSLTRVIYPLTFSPGTVQRPTRMRKHMIHIQTPSVVGHRASRLKGTSSSGHSVLVSLLLRAKRSQWAQT